MSNVEILKPLKTWSHLSTRRRKPSEYEIVTTRLHYHDRDPNAPYEQDPNTFMNEWYKKNTYGSPLKHEDWNAFRDPDEVVYRTYNMMQDGQETYVYGLFDQFSKREHDKSLTASWVGTLSLRYAPARYLFHTLQMVSAYLGQFASVSIITVCWFFQMADSLRWLTHTAYRTKELDLAHPEKGFTKNERAFWESEQVWQGYRELMEKVLVTWDWAEAFVALNLVAKPAIEEGILRNLSNSARHNGDELLAMLCDAQMIDASRHRRWSEALVKMALENESNHSVIQGWINKWEPLADKAIDLYCSGMPDVPDAADDAKNASRAFRKSLGF
ncbi:MAG: toluene monooxygenase [Polynucleobacter sp.]|nr:MAG: toluene monooxygenase [Polynucleobacter sp.]